MNKTFMEVSYFNFFQDFFELEIQCWKKFSEEPAFLLPFTKGNLLLLFLFSYLS